MPPAQARRRRRLGEAVASSWAAVPPVGTSVCGPRSAVSAASDRARPDSHAVLQSVGFPARIACLSGAEQIPRTAAVGRIPRSAGENAVRSVPLRAVGELPSRCGCPDRGTRWACSPKHTPPGSGVARGRGRAGGCVAPTPARWSLTGDEWRRREVRPESRKPSTSRENPRARSLANACSASYLRTHVRGRDEACRWVQIAVISPVVWANSCSGIASCGRSSVRWTRTR
jgi:hypothetical protein